MAEYIIHIRIKETLSKEWSAWFDGLSVTLEEDGNTHLVGCIPDQSAARGILGKLWNLNLTIISFSLNDSIQPKRKILVTKTDP